MLPVHLPYNYSSLKDKCYQPFHFVVNKDYSEFLAVP